MSPLAMEQYYNTLRIMASQGGTTAGEKTAALLATQSSPSSTSVGLPSSHSKVSGRKSPVTPDTAMGLNVSGGSSAAKRDKRSDRCDYCGKVMTRNSFYFCTTFE